MMKIVGAKVFKNGEFVEDDIFIEGDRIVAGCSPFLAWSTCIPMARWGTISATVRMSRSTPSRAMRPVVA